MIKRLEHLEFCGNQPVSGKAQAVVQPSSRSSDTMLADATETRMETVARGQQLEGEGRASGVCSLGTGRMASMMVPPMEVGDRVLVDGMAGEIAFLGMGGGTRELW